MIDPATGWFEIKDLKSATAEAAMNAFDDVWLRPSMTILAPIFVVAVPRMRFGRRVGSGFLRQALGSSVGGE